jgi:cytochrome c oxidase subunit 4
MTERVYQSSDAVPADAPGERGPISPERTEEHTGEALLHGSLTTYYTVFAILIALTLLTVGAAYLPLGQAGWVHTAIALAIAAAKATLVLLFFMHLWYSPRLTWLIAFGSLLWLAIMLVLTWADYWSRDWLDY